ncbi:hypothetical protein [Kitasatospora sp. NPDC050543]|uniref:hypothetical protein n=1 Tax=Kitasatospora sp. NPDC050543 TaxID=3364054 RepID=UPI0037B7E097
MVTQPGIHDDQGHTPLPPGQKPQNDPDFTPPKPHQYTGGTNVDEGHHTDPWTYYFRPPEVPSSKGGGKGTSVATPSMDLFAKNMQVLQSVTPVAEKFLQEVDIRPGSFYHANKMRLKINGANGDDGLKEWYIKVFRDLGVALLDLHDGIVELSTKYKSIEDLNSITSTDLQNIMTRVQGDFSKMLGDIPKPSGGGAPPPAPPGTGAP